MPAGLVLFGAELTLLTVADDADAVGVDAGGDDGLLGGVGAIFAEGDVVLGGAAVVAVAGDEDFDVLMRVEIGGGGGDGWLVGGTDVVAVVVEEEILDCGVEGSVGSLQPGRDGNVVVWDGDPFEFATRAIVVLVRGRESHAPSRQDQLTERYQPKPAAR